MLMTRRHCWRVLGACNAHFVFAVGPDRVLASANKGTEDLGRQNPRRLGDSNRRTWRATGPAEYYAIPAENLKTYPVYHPDREPAGYWDWLHKQKPPPLVEVSKLRTRLDWIRAGGDAFQNLDNPTARTSDPGVLAAARNARSYEGILMREDGSLLDQRWVVTESGIQLGLTVCGSCHARVMTDGKITLGLATSRRADEVSSKKRVHENQP